MLRCDKCDSLIPLGSKFCPQCADPVTVADRTVTTPARQIEIAQVEISFGHSGSPNYSRAVEMCRKIPSYSCAGEQRETRHTVTLPMTEVELILNLYDLVSNWKGAQMLINGQVATKKDLIYHGMGCYRDRQKAYQPEQFCFGERPHEANIWGCKRLNMPVNEYGGGWLDYGNFDDFGVWHFDKAKIGHDLELGIKNNDICPALNRARILETLNRLPPTVDPKTDQNWTYRTTFQWVDYAQKEVAVGIKPILRKVHGYVVGEYKPVWDAGGAPMAANSTDDPNFSNKQSSYSKTFSHKSKWRVIWWALLGILLALLLFR